MTHRTRGKQARVTPFMQGEAEETCRPPALPDRTAGCRSSTQTQAEGPGLPGPPGLLRGRASVMSRLGERPAPGTRQDRRVFWPLQLHPRRSWVHSWRRGHVLNNTEGWFVDINDMSHRTISGKHHLGCSGKRGGPLLSLQPGTLSPTCKNTVDVDNGPSCPLSA